MKHNWILAPALLLAAALALTGTAAAQGLDGSALEGNGAFEDESALANEQALGDGGLNNAALGLLATDSLCVGEGISPVVSTDFSLSADSTRDQDVELDEDRTLLAIALANNGFGGISFADVAATNAVRTDTAALAQETAVDREDVFSAVALGADTGLSEADQLACASDITSEAEVSVAVDETVDLDDETVLLSIALANNLGGGGVSFGDVVDSSSDVRTELTTTRDVDVDRDEALLLLAFG